MINPVDKHCWRTCISCHRCADKGTRSQCSHCSGRYDPHGKWDPYDIDDYCDCRNGVLRFKTQSGKRLIAKIPRDPFKGRVQSETTTSDERDYMSYLQNSREALNDPSWDPVRFSDGASTDRWMTDYLKGRV